MKVVKTFETVRKFLGWSYQEVSVKSGKYSSEFLEQIHQGRPFPEVEKDLIMTYVQGLAERAVHLVFGGQIQSDTRDKLIAKFAQIVRQWNLSLEDTQALVEKVSRERISEASFRSATLDVSVEVIWEDVLEEIVRDLNESGQGMLFEDDDENVDEDSHPVLVSSKPLVSRQPNRDSQALVLPVCPYCHILQPENRNSKHTCGYPNSDYL